MVSIKQIALIAASCLTISAVAAPIDTNTVDVRASNTVSYAEIEGAVGVLNDMGKAAKTIETLSQQLSPLKTVNNALPQQFDQQLQEGLLKVKKAIALGQGSLSALSQKTTNQNLDKLASKFGQ